MPHPRLFWLFAGMAAALFSIAEYPFPELEDLTVESARFEPGERTFRSRAWLTTFSRQRVYCRSGRSRALCASPAIRALEAGRAQVTVWHDGSQVFQIMGSSGLLMSLEDVREQGCNAFPLGVLSLVLALACAFSPDWRKLRPGWL